MRIHGSRSQLPASSSSLASRSLLSRLANTQPADPAPTMTRRPSGIFRSSSVPKPDEGRAFTVTPATLCWMPNAAASLTRADWHPYSDMMP
jgi:hypothetical protein